MGRRLFCGLGLLVLFALVSLGWESNAVARQRTRGAAKAVKALATAEIVNALKSAHQLLVAADGDYNGNRALAAKEVHKALMELEHRKNPALAQPGAPVNTAGGAAGAAAKKAASTSGQKAGREAQAVSDAQLRQAQQLLQGALSHVNARHPKAAVNVQAAIGHITTALAIK
jgi:hypothetical protein